MKTFFRAILAITGCLLFSVHGNKIAAQCTPPGSITVSQPGSCTAPNGSITIGTPVPTANYLFSKDDGVTFQASNIFNSLAPGTYYLRTKEIATGCISTRVTQVLNNPAGSVTSTQTNNSNCSGTPNGTITFTAPTGAYTYSIDGGANFQASAVFNNVAAGTYTLVAKSTATGCTSFTYEVVGNSFVTPATPTSSNLNPTACNVADGRITVNGPAPLANYSFSNDGGTTFQTGNVFNGLAVGSYSVVAKNNATGCLSSVLLVTLTGITVTTPAATATANTNCTGTPNGSITINTPSPATDYSFSIDGGLTFQAGNIFNNLLSGTYRLVAKSNATACTSAEGSVVVNNGTGSPGASTVTTTSATSCLTPDGTITVTAPSSGVLYSIDNGITFQNSNFFSNLAKGTYQVVVKGISTGCVSSVNAVTVSGPVVSAPVFSASVNNSSCLSTGNGVLNISSPSGANIEYSMNGGPFQSSPSFPGLSGGTYTLVARNISNGCVSSASNTTVSNVPQSISVSVSSANPTICSPANGQITVTTPLPPGYTYSIDGGITFQASNVFSGLSGGTYNPVVKSDATGCTGVPAGAVTLTQPIVSGRTTTSVSNTSCTAPNGSITFTGPTPSSDFTFSINGGGSFQPGPVFNNLPARTYQVIAKSNITGCLTSLGNQIVTDNVSTPSTPAATKSDVTQCTTPNGSITITGPAGILTGYTYSIDNGVTFQSLPVFNNLSAGTYNVVARNSTTNCVSNDLVVTINNPVIAAPAVSITPNTSCTAGGNGSITITAPTTGVSYSIDGGATFQPGNVFNNILPGTYNVVTRNLVTNCISAVASAVVPDNSAPATPTFTVSNPTSCTTANGSITVNSPTGPTFEFSINNGVSFQASNSFVNLPSGTYNIVARTISTICLSIPATAILTDPVVVNPTSSVGPNTICSGSPNGTITFTGPTPLANYSFSINNGATFQPGTTFTGLLDGTYQTKAKNNVTGCISAAVAKTVALSPSSVATPVRTIVNNSSCITPDGSITVTSPVPSNNYTFSIDNGTTFQPGNFFGGLSAGTYNLVVKSIATGCVSSAVATTIANPFIPVPTFTVSANTGCEIYNGVITFASPAKGTGYEYSIDDGVTYQANNVFNGLNGGTYRVVIRSLSTGCRSAGANLPVSNSPTVPVIPGIQIVQPISCSAADGRITIIGFSPVSSYTYSIDDGATFSASPVFNNLSPATYKVRVKRLSDGCVSNASNATLNNPTAVVPSAAGTSPVTCNPATGSIAFTVASPGSLSNYEFSIDGGSTYQASPQFNNLSAGQYQTFSRFINTGCIYSTGVITLTSPAVPTPTVTTTPNTICQGVPDGSLTITGPLGGRYQYSINNGGNWQSARYFNSLTPSQYTLLVKDTITGCISSGLSTVVSNNIAALVPVTTTTPSSSCTTPNGRITFTGPTPLNNLIFSIVGANGTQSSTSPDFINLASGDYVTYVQNTITGCRSNQTGLVTVALAPAFPTITYTATNPTRCTPYNGSISFTVQIPYPYSDFEYSIDDGVTYQANPVFNNLGTGSYKLRFRSLITGCNSVPATPVVTLNQPVVANSVITSITGATFCSPGNGSIAFTAPTPFASYQYSIDGGNTFSAQHVFYGLTSGTYSVAIRAYSSNCTTTPAEAIVPLTSPVPDPVFNQVDPTICLVADGQITITSPVGPANQYQYSIDDGATFQASNDFQGLAAGVYTVVVKNVMTGCLSSRKGTVLNCTGNPTLVKSAFKNGGTVPATSVSINDIINYVIQIGGHVPVSPPTLTDVMSNNQQYIANSAKAENWTLNGGTAAWFGPTGNGTATATYTGALTNSPNGGFIPTYGFNEYLATNTVAGGTSTNITFSGGGDGMQPIYWKTDDCQEKVMVINHIATNTPPKCWNLTTNVNCDNDLANLRNANLNFSGSFSSNWSVTVDNKVYVVNRSDGAHGITNNVVQWDCIDLNPAGNPFYCSGFPKSLPGYLQTKTFSDAEVQTLLISPISNTNSYDTLNDRIYIYADSASFRLLYSLKVSTGEITEAVPIPKPAAGTAGEYAKTVNIGYNRILLEGVNSTQCINTQYWPVLRDCNSTYIPGVFSIYGRDNTEKMYLSSPLLDNFSNLIGFCIASEASTNNVPNLIQCFTTGGAPVAAPPGYVGTFGFSATYKIFGTKVITMGGTPADGFNGTNYYCYDFADRSNCGTSINQASDGYGMEWRVPGKCFLVYGDRGVLTQWGIEPTGLVLNSDLCRLNSCNSFSEIVPDPSIRFCGPQVDHIEFKNLKISGLPDIHGQSTVTISCGGSPIATFDIPANATVFAQDISGLINYASCPQPEITVNVPGVPPGVVASVNTQIAYNNDGRFPEICYDAKVILCDANQYTNDVTIDGGGVATVVGNTNVASDCIPLPVKLTDFTASSRGCIVKLGWTTAEEVNSDRFELERSIDGGNNYTLINSVSALGSGSIYSYTDNAANSGKNLYRLKMIDKDGHYSYSKIILVSLNCDGSQTIILYPNPARDKVTIAGLKKGDKIELYGVNGQLLIKKITMNEQEQLDLSRFPNGLYAVIVSNQESILTTIKVVRN